MAHGDAAAAAARREHEQTWITLRDGIDRVMTRLTEGIDMKTYMVLYTSVHNFCTSPKGVNQSSASMQSNGQRGGETQTSQDGPNSSSI